MNQNELQALPTINYLAPDLKLGRDENGNLKVFDPIRKKYLVLTPEEWVRQNFIGWLAANKGYPWSHMANELEIHLNNTKKRCDTVIFDRACMPLMIIEYKAPNVEITQQTFDQIVRYNLILKVKYLIVTNGRQAFCCVMDYIKNSYNFIPLIPDFNQAAGMPGEN